jgi:hypothetical protein
VEVDDELFEERGQFSGVESMVGTWQKSSSGGLYCARELPRQRFAREFSERKRGGACADIRECSFDIGPWRGKAGWNYRTTAWPMYRDISRPRRIGKALGELRSRRDVRGDDKRSRARPTSSRMLVPDGLETLQCTFDVTEDERAAAGLYLNVVAPRRSDDFDILVGLNLHHRRPCRARTQEACCCVEVLVQKAAVYGLNPFKLTAIKHRRWRGSGHRGLKVGLCSRADGLEACRQSSVSSIIVR